MKPTRRAFDLRTALLIGAGTALGVAWAFFNLYRAGGSGAAGTTAPLIWTVFAIPLFAFWGWLLARHDEGWLAAFVCFCIYFFSIFIAARVEQLLLGSAAATTSVHALYFRLTPAVQLIACAVVALQRAGSRGTMQSATDQ